jgi:hypothetical protein
VSVPSPPPHLLSPTVTRRRFGGRWTALRGPHELALATRMVEPALQQLREQHQLGVAERWVASPGAWTSTGTAVFSLGAPGQAPVALLRLSPTGGERLNRESTVFTQLSDAALPEDVRSVLPRRLAAGQVRGCTFVVDALLPGQPAERFAKGPGWPALQGAALAAVAALHHATASVRVGDDALVRDWVDAPVAVLAAVLKRFPQVTSPARLEAVREQITSALVGRDLTVCWVHGDFWPGNLLVDPASQRLTGIVDWDLAAPSELPIHDYLHLLLYRRRVIHGGEIGDIVSGLLSGRAAFTSDEQQTLAGAAQSFWGSSGSSGSSGEAPPLRALLLLYWLRYVAAISLQQRSYVTHSVRVWELRNVHRVLRVV